MSKKNWKQIKIIRFTYFSLLGFLAFNGCKQDATLKSKEYPILLTSEVTNNDTTGVTFNAIFLDKGKLAIQEFGFVFNESHSPTIENNLVKDTSNLIQDTYNFRIYSNLIIGQIYYVRAYAKTAKNLIYGNEVNFVCLGSPPPIINSFTPDSGFDGTTIVISGKNFSTKNAIIKVKIGKNYAGIMSSTNTEIVVKSPFVNYFGKYKIDVEVAGQTVSSQNDYTILGPQISSLAPQNAEPGDLVTILGNHLKDNINETNVYFDNILADIISADSNKLIVRVPPFTQNFNTITLQTGSKKVSQSYQVKISQIYKKLATPNFTNVFFFSTFSTDKRGYVFAYDKIWQYEPDADIWSVVCAYPGITRYNSFAFTINNKVYIGGGYDYFGTNVFEFWEYDIDLNTWKKLKDVPVITYPSRGFALNGSGYVFGYNSLWKYNPADNSWIQMDNIPSNYNDIITFVTNNIAYAKIKGSKNNFFEFSESTGKWIKRADCPLEYTSYSISLNKRGYLGYIYSGKLYEYKPENDVWVKKLSYPGCNSCTYYFGFAINNVGYIGNISSCNGDCNSSFYSFLP